MAGVLLRPVWPVARREEGASPTSGAVTDEQRSHRPNWAQPKGRQSFSLQASLLTPYRSTSGYARRSRLAWTEKPLPQNTSHLGDTTLARACCKSPFLFRSADAYIRELSEKPQRRSRGCGHRRSYFATFGL